VAVLLVPKLDEKRQIKLMPESHMGQCEKK
jgi:hypothetical protein